MSGSNMVVLEAMNVCNRPFTREWSTVELEPVLIYKGADGLISSWFTEIVFAPVRSSQGRYLCDLYAAYERADAADWHEWALYLYRPARMLHAVAEIAKRHALPKIGIWIRLPYPLIDERSSMEGEVDHHKIEIERVQKLVSWIGEVLQLWEHADHMLIRERLSLRGFVWGREAIPWHDVNLVSSVNEWLCDRGLRTLWLANYRSLHVLDWKQKLKFSWIALYPNYTGNTEYDKNWLQHTGQYAATHRMGVQMIAGRGRLYGSHHVQHYVEFLKDYESKGGSGPFVYRFPNYSIIEIYQQRLDLYELLYRSCLRDVGGK